MVPEFSMFVMISKKQLDIGETKCESAKESVIQKVHQLYKKFLKNQK